MLRVLGGLFIVALFWAFGGGGAPAQTPGPGKGRLCVTKYLDEDGDGQRDPDEGVLSGWSFTFSGQTIAPVASGVTDHTGRFCSDVWPGTYMVSENLVSGVPAWVNTDPGPNSLGFIRKQNIRVFQGKTTEVVFGNRPKPGNICIYKYLDANRDGLWWADPSEPNLQGWKFSIRNTSNQVVASGVTNGDGQFCAEVKAGTYTVSEVAPIPGGWVNTDPGGPGPYEKTVSVYAGGVELVRFGNAPPPPPPVEDVDINLCCTPWTQAAFQASMVRVPGNPGHFFEKFVPSATLNAQMHAYIDYLHTLNAATTTITVALQLRDGPTGNVIATGSVQWVAGSTANPTTNLFANQLIAGRSYQIVSVVQVDGGIVIPKGCRTWNLDISG